MSLLDSLEKEADDARRRRAEHAAARANETAASSRRLVPVLERACEYFSSLCAHLNDIDREVVTRYEVAGLGSLEGLAQRDYGVFREPGSDGGDGFRVSFRCEGKSPLDAKLDSDAVARRYERSLKDAGLGCRRGAQGAKLVRLTVEPKVPVTLTFSIDGDRDAIRVNTRNLFELGCRSHRFEPERICEPLLQALAQCMLREPNDFAALCGDAVDDGSRAEIRRQLARDRRRREAELGGRLRRALFPLAERIRRTFLGR